MATELSIVYSAYGTCAYPVTIANRKKQKKKKKKMLKSGWICTPLEGKRDNRIKEMMKNDVCKNLYR